MQPIKKASTLTDQQIIERLAGFMGFEKREPFTDEENKKGYRSDSWWLNSEFVGWCSEWNPLKDWNHWRQVEEKVMKDGQLFANYLVRVKKLQEDTILPAPMATVFAMKADLPTRCRALISVLPTND